MKKAQKLITKIICLCMALLFFFGNVYFIETARAGVQGFDSSVVNKGVSNKPEPQRHAEALVLKASSYMGKSQSALGYKVEWCALFVGKCAKESGVPNSVIPHNVSTVSTFHSTMVKKGLKAYTTSDLKSGTYKPEVGDLVFWDTDKKFGHIGIVFSISADGSFTTIDGNVTDSSDNISKVNTLTVESDGSFSGASIKINSFIRPNYSAMDK